MSFIQIKRKSKNEEKYEPKNFLGRFTESLTQKFEKLNFEYSKK